MEGGIIREIVVLSDLRFFFFNFFSYQVRRRAKTGVSLRFLINFYSSYQLVYRKSKKTESKETERHSEIENNNIVIHDT